MKLTREDKTILKEIGVPDSDFSQIERAASKTNFEHYPKIGVGWKISMDKAIELLGRKSFLSGLARSAFHWSAMRETENGDTIYFDSSKFFA